MRRNIAWPVWLLPAVATASAAAGQGEQQQTNSEVEVEWRVADRFRLFDQVEGETRAKVAGLLETLSNRPEAPLADFYDDYLAVLSDRGSEWQHSGNLRRSNYEPGTDERAIPGRYSETYLYPESYRIELRALALSGSDCTWRSPSGERRGACGEWTAIPVPNNGRTISGSGAHGALSWTASGGQSGSVTFDFADELVVALGDSFISGEGNPDVPSLISQKTPPSFFAGPS